MRLTAVGIQPQSSVSVSQLPHTARSHDVRVGSEQETRVQEYHASPSDIASYGATSFWDERYSAGEKVRYPRDKKETDDKLKGTR